MDPVLARKMHRTLEPYHGVVYFAPEPAAAYAELGVTGRSGYFASRAAPMGAVDAEVVVATFFNFHPDLVRRSMEGTWSAAAPAALIEARHRGVDATLRRILDESVASPEVEEAAALARIAAADLQPAGRPLFAGHASLDWPHEPHMVLWHAFTLLREFRGDGHIAALVAAGVADGCEALVQHASTGEIGGEVLRSSRAWPPEAWTATLARLVERGWVEPDGSATDEGRAVREAIEQRTDELAMQPWQQLGQDGADRLRELVRPLSRTIVASGDFGLR